MSDTDKRAEAEAQLLEGFAMPMKVAQRIRKAARAWVVAELEAIALADPTARGLAQRIKTLQEDA